METGFDLLRQSAPLLLKGAGYTILLSVIGMGVGVALGFGLALMRLSRTPLLRWPAAVYISAFRGTPLLVQLFLIYYGLPQFGLEMPALVAAGIGFSLNVAAYSSEILRSAIDAVDKAQWEAASVLGMSRGQTLRRVILPQAARTAVAPLSNSFIGLVKDTSLAATIQVPELFRQAQLITARTYEIFTMYLAAAAIYWILSTLLATVQARLERRAAEGRR
ncbi:cystine ABC transporter permease [Caulobacter sp. RHG1]|uniref:cystine ABC transporter permease n=1 Tax=Caulobacter sp. (strain RHG1) TaxID=2545762 RepID=UPI0015550544|nr:cystine ABC transporter permease [Caulobacter sp. RHG1]NQE61181.1 L-cystine ABC transporter (wide substrate range), permease protein YecS [Caulobacter sp. RHG1]